MISLFTFVIIAISSFIGYLIGTKQLNKIVENKIDMMKKQVTSGPVKAKTPEEIKLSKDGEYQRKKELMGF
jgi:hypothetical protein